VVSEILGHSSIAITLDLYSHAIPSMQEEAASRVARLFLGTEGAG
jgi:integrase